MDIKNWYSVEQEESDGVTWYKDHLGNQEVDDLKEDTKSQYTYYIR